ncbi:DHHC palmitoyltransferase-domain-containing protein [Protomyces lactucae-debilis]|uniref:Palmitoyltransferase n=1 Tax=Protomyces lactucae-debilis TaxID=2754530 RepID=A0A1Y2FU84_PROLT|nr:DHHC palmitoyltransferase-domain-containing protein [Protomyces lactucae-debilis]ORY87127.1 DHHC palmitoyltransferase-domain-containing protein [Protomyces lactucae-debilis]
MVSLPLLLTFICVFSLVTFLVLFGHVPALKQTPIGQAKTLLTIKLPSLLDKLDARLIQGRLRPVLQRSYQRVAHERHPIVLWFYLILYCGCVCIYLLRAAPLLSTKHRMCLPILIAAPLWSLFKAASTDPGIITAENHAYYMQRYKYDQVLYRTGQDCRTCRRSKVARSKHCPLCNKCVAKHDHHCVWINGCVGEQNMRFFLVFLISNIITFSYAFIVLVQILLAKREVAKASLSVLATLRLDPALGSLALFSGICNLLVFVFLFYHLYLVWSGVTTNETLKFEDVRNALHDGEIALVVRERQAMLVKREVVRKNEEITLRQLNNVYDAGWLANLSSVLQPNAG